MKRGKWRAALGMAAVYVALLTLLVWAEDASEEATIRTLPTAIWYSLTTLTNVGYGDVYPVTGPGRVIGGIFVLLSTGLLVVLIGALVSLLRTGLIPMLRLRLGVSREWFIFADCDRDAMELAKHLRRERPGALLIFPAHEGDLPAGVRVDASLERLLALKRGRGNCAVLFLGEDGYENYRRAAIRRGIPRASGAGIRCLSRRSRARRGVSEDRA